jgi:hypothetical protein
MLGLDLGPEQTMLAGAPDDNPKGFWEQEPIRILNDDLLAFLGGRWYDGLDLQPGWERRADIAPFYERGRKIVKELFPEDRAWAWKDPRTCLTLPFWKLIVHPAAYVICVRNPIEVAASLEKRDPVAHPRSRSLDLWLQQNCGVLQSTRGDRRLFVLFDDWFESTGRQVERLSRFLGLAVPSAKEVARIEAVIGHDLRHQRSSGSRELDAANVDHEVVAAYELLRGLAHDDSAGAEGTEEFVEGLWDHLCDRRQEVERLRGELHGQTEELAHLRQQVARQAAELTKDRELLTEVLQSHSWRITSPLRSSRRWLATRRG